MGKLSGKVVAVTGASSGIGAILAVRLAELEAIPVLIARRGDKLSELAKQIQGDYLTIEADVTVLEQVEAAAAQIVERYGRIDVWVNNAGAGLFETVIDMPIAQFRQMMDVIYMSIVYCVKTVLPIMLTAGQGHIVNVVSVAGKLGTAKSAAYSASKHAALGLTNSLRAELIGTGIRVSSINPGPIDTPFFDIADPSGHYKKNVGWFMLKPEKVVNQICKILMNGKAEVTLPWTASVGAKALQLFPNVLSGIAGKLLNKK